MFFNHTLHPRPSKRRGRGRTDVTAGMKLLLYAEAVFRIPEDILQAALREGWSACGFDLDKQVQVVDQSLTLSGTPSIYSDEWDPACACWSEGSILFAGVGCCRSVIGPNHI